MSSAVVKSAILAACLTLCSSLHAQAQEPNATRSSANRQHEVPVPSARAAQRNGPIVIDGNVNDAAWAAAQPVTEFTQTDPDE